MQSTTAIYMEPYCVKLANGAKIAGAGWHWDHTAVDGSEHKGSIDSLDELLEALRLGGEVTVLGLDGCELQIDALPNWGEAGEDPDDTVEVWSWDKTRLLVGTCADDYEIVPREDLEGR